MATVRDIISASLRMIGVLDPVEALSPEQGAVGLLAFNSLVDSWNTDSLAIFTINRSVFPLTIGQQVYTLGIGGNFNMVRPTWIENASVLLTAVTPQVELPIKIDQDEDWQRINVKAVTSSFPTEVYPDGSFPLSNLYFWPVPMAVCSFVLYSPDTISAFSDLNAQVAFPPGYERAFKFNLAVEIAPEFGISSPPDVKMIAASSLDAIQKLNWTPREMDMDPMFRNKNGSSVGVRSRGAVVDP